MKKLKKFGLMIVLITTITAVKAQTFSNPILSNFYHDPSICKAGNDYYILNTSFVNYLGLHVFYSKYLLNWLHPASQLLNYNRQ